MHKQYNMKKLYAVFFSLLITSYILTACTSPSSPIEASGFYFDTIIQITLYDSSKKYALDHCMELAKIYEGYFSETKPDSDITKINTHPNTPVKVHAETAELIRKGIAYGKISDGKFDISIGRVSSLWDFHNEESPSLPENATIKKALKHVNYRNIIVKGQTVTLKDDQAAINIGGIAKGYIADKMKEYLIKEGISSGLINLGGNVLTLKEKPDHTSYTIGIQKPFSEDGTPALSVNVKDSSVVTSGTYQRCFTIDNRLYHHIIDPKTGYPCDNSLASVTIFSKTSTDGDALSTTVFLMGPKKGMRFVESKDNIEAVFLTQDGEIMFSSGMGKEISYKEYTSN